MLRRHGRWTGPLIAACFAPTAFGQATVNPDAEGRNIEGVPAPAIERFDPVLDAWWQDAVFYQVFTRSFADSTEGPWANDGTGDLRGLIERLDYLNDGDPTTDDDLGITGLWIMPITESGGYHGYEVLDYINVDTEFGDNETFRELVRECEKRGMRVILDVVLNHSSWNHPWFLEAQSSPDSPKRDWYIWADQDPGYKGPWNQKVWHQSPAGDGSWYYGVFWHGMPDINFENADASAAMLEVVRYWQEEMGVHGFRLDAIRHLIEDGETQDNTPETHAWLQDFFRFYKSIDPDAVTVGEVWSNAEVATRFVGDQMDIAFEFDTAYALIDSVSRQDRERLDVVLGDVLRLYPSGMYATFVHNHDMHRAANRFAEVEGATDEDIDAMIRLAASLQFSLPGVPFIYYGEEIGQRGMYIDYDNRAPMPWSTAPHAGFSSVEPKQEVNEGWRERNVETQRAVPGSILNHYRRVIGLRHAHETLRKGELVVLKTDRPEVFALARRPIKVGEGDTARTFGEGDFLCVFNLSGEVVEDAAVYLPEELRSRGVEDVLGGLMVLATGFEEVWTLPELKPRSAAYLKLD
ncbi:MAG: alpha-amylase family glycosyl hydrolase [Planctomycetota bacterium]